jgi:hypothetical protein
LENADSPIVKSLQGVSNVKFERLVQDSKHDLPIVVIEEGMQTD